MCLIFVAIQSHPTYKLIIAANRDEFYNRKTEPASFWKDHPHILGGRDLEAHGTWMAMTKKGKISMVTNYRDPHNINPSAPSRGQLVSDFLMDESSPLEYLKKVEEKGSRYNGFNLVTGQLDDLYYYSNYKVGIDKLNPGIHGLSNHLLDTPWPKVNKGKDKLKDLLSRSTLSSEMLFQFLQDEDRAPDELLPDTGIGLERERALSSMFIKTAGYGTRCSTVILVDQSNEVEFTERVFDLTTFAFSDTSFRFPISM